MKTLKLRLEPSGLSRFKTLKFECVDVPLGKLLSEGLHPDGYGKHRNDSYTTGIHDALGDRINMPEMKLPGLEEHGYCHDIDLGTGAHYNDHSETAAYEALEQMGNRILLVEDLSFAELFNVAKGYVESNWSHRLAKTLLGRLCYDFNGQRRFIKSKDSNVKLSSRADINNYELARILSPSDFFQEEKMVIDHGLPMNLNFRKESFLKTITTPEGYLCMGVKINHFAIEIKNQDTYLKYNCTPKDGVVEFTPSFEDSTGSEGERRAFGQAMSSQYGNGTRYIFTCPVDFVEEMLENGARIHFPALNYRDSEIDKTSPVSMAAVNSHIKVPAFAIKSPVTERTPNARLKTILGDHGEKVSGVKEQLVERLVNLCAKLYKKAEPGLSEFFKDRYIRVDGNHKTGGIEPFPLEIKFEGMTDESSLRKNVLVMYVVGHMRGTRILDRNHCNNTYSVRDLAKAVISKDVSVHGVFVKVSDPSS